MSFIENMSNWLQNLHKDEDIKRATEEAKEMVGRSTLTSNFETPPKKIQYKKANNSKRNLCRHNPNESCACCTTLSLIPKRVMTFPPVFSFVCSECGQAFKFTQNEDGEYVSYTSPQV